MQGIIFRLTATPPGSPLNRVSFLRSEPPFLSRAVRHPSARFVLLNELAPLVRSPTELYYASYQDVKSFVPEDIFDKSQEEILSSYNSGRTLPLLVFLGINESHAENALQYKNYTGAPYFALDITPKADLEKEAKSIIETMESGGLTFLRARTITSLLPGDGIYLLILLKVKEQ